MLSENDQIISDETTIADTMNKHFNLLVMYQESKT